MSVPLWYRILWPCIVVAICALSAAALVLDALIVWRALA